MSHSLQIRPSHDRITRRLDAAVLVAKALSTSKRARSRTSLVPDILATLTFVSGTVLLLSGALPAASGRLALLDRIAPPLAIEASHFVASMVGAGLLLLARGLQRRLDAAWLLAVALLAAGVVMSAGKGLDFEEAILVGMTLVTLLPFRRHFYRKSSLLSEPFSVAWIASILIVLSVSAGLLVFAYTHTAYSTQPWWQFALEAEAARSLRATVGAIGLTGLVALHRLIRPVHVKLSMPCAADIDRARPLVEQSKWTYANLAFRGDKALLFSDAGDAVLMYGRQGRSWIAMGDPVGSENGVRELLWRFRDLCDRFDGWCVFFEVRPERRHLYADLGLRLTQLGEEARVDLSRFALDTPVHKDLRQARAKLIRGGHRFEVLPRETVPAVLPALTRISNAWLATKATHEKEFSSASFDAGYLTRFPVAVVHKGDEIVAFANLWLSAAKEELSVDLMRYLPAAPNGTMDFLFSELLLWGRSDGFRWFNFGLAPLSGLDSEPGAPLWDVVATFLYRHGEHFYNFDGLRRYKAKFDPIWTPLYLASPGGSALPRILLDVTALIGGGLTGIVSKYAVKDSLLHVRRSA